MFLCPLSAETLMVGDDVRVDVLGAQEAGIQVGIFF